MYDQQSLINAEMIYQNVVNRMMPEQAKLRAIEDRAGAATVNADFLTPNWAGLTPITVVTMREAVALACGINLRYAWTIEHRVGDGDALTAIEAARDLLDYFVVKRGVTPATKIALDSVADWMRDLGRTLPAGFPGAATTQADSSVSTRAETQTERQARRYQLCIDQGLPMPRDDYGRLPNGIRQLADREGITRQAFAEDVKAHLARTKR